MTLVGLAVVVVALYLAFKVAGAMLRLLLWAVVLLGAYWLLMPVFGRATLL